MKDATTQSLKDDQKRLAEDFRTVLNDAEELLRHAARDAGDGYNEARDRLEQSLKVARNELESAEQALVDGARRAGRATDSYVHDHPWESIAIGAGIGLVLGLLIARR
jgi:ElaB/YqjD/DUF883 family membrane-anchored ribosome-binding protein